MLRFTLWIGAATGLACSAFALPSVQVEVHKVGDGPMWEFAEVVRPSRSDAGQHAVFSLLDGSLQKKCAPLDRLQDGLVPISGDDGHASTFFADTSRFGGLILADMGAVLPIMAVCTYSWHESDRDGGARGPQVYTLYGSRSPSQAPAIDNLDSNREWLRIARVDTRPNATGEGWGGQYGVKVSKGQKPLGRFRYLLWRIEPTCSPLIGDRVGWSHTFYQEFDIHTRKSLTHAGDATVIYPNLEKVFVLHKTHYDIGYTDFADRVVDLYSTLMMDAVLGLQSSADRKPPFVWYMPGWAAKEVLRTNQGQDRHPFLVDSMKKGLIPIHAWPFTTHTESMELEELVRGLGFASAASRELGLSLPRDAKLTDVPCHSWVLPTLLKHSGVDFLHIGGNPASSAAEVPRLFWWEGPDGSRLLTLYSPGEYGTYPLPPDGWPHKAWMALFSTGDNRRPWSQEILDRNIDRMRAVMPHVELRPGRPSDFAEAILDEDPELPVVRGDMPDTWIHGVMSYPVETRIARQVRPQISALDALGCLIECWGASASNSVGEAVASSYEKSVLFGEHTWGLGVQSNFGPRLYGEAWSAARGSGVYERLEASWDQKAGLIQHARGLVAHHLTLCLDQLAAGVRVDGERVVVFNPLPWKRTAVASCPVASLTAGLRDAESGEPAAVEANDIACRFVARDLPALGYRTYTVDTNAPFGRVGVEAGEGEVAIENEFFRIAVDASTGRMVSFFDKRLGREWARCDSGVGLGTYLYEHFSQAEIRRFITNYTTRSEWTWIEQDFGKPGLPPAEEAPYRSAFPRGGTGEVHRGHVTQSIVVHLPPREDLPHGVKMTFTLAAGRPFVDVTWSVKNKPEDPWPEAGWLCFDFAMTNPVYRLARMNSIVDPTNDVIRGANRELYGLTTGMALIGEDGAGVALCPIDSPLVSLDRPGLWTYEQDFVPTNPAVFVNLYNNQWSTNFRQWLGGSWSSRVRLWTFDRFDPASSLVTPGLETRNAVLAVVSPASGGSLPPSQSGVELSLPGVQVTAFGPNPDGAGVVLRLWEQAGDDGPCTITFPKGLRADWLQPVDLRGRAGGYPIPVVDGRATVEIHHFAPASFVLMMPDTPDVKTIRSGLGL